MMKNELRTFNNTSITRGQLLIGITLLYILWVPSGSAETHLGIGATLTNVEYQWIDGRQESGEPLGYSVWIEHDFGKFVSIQLAHTDFGNLEGDTDVVLGIEGAITSTIDIEYQSVSLAIVGNYPLSTNFVLSAAAGIENWTAEYTYRSDDLFGLQYESGGKDDIDLYWHVGARYQLTPEWKASMKYAHRNWDAAINGANLKFDSVTVGMSYGF